MGKLVPVPITIPPGVVATESLQAAEGRWVLPMDKVRFVRGKPQKIGGNKQLTSTAMWGTPRATLCWQDYLQNGYVACGTYQKLYAFDSSFDLNDITPFISTGTLGANPFTTTNGSTSVEVADTAHGLIVGQIVIFAGATAFNNVTMNGTFQVVTVVDANNYTVTATTTANASGSGGGSSVTFEYEIPPGTDLGAYGQGWGTGPWGLGTWGTARGSSTIFFAGRVWSLDYFGEILVAAYNGGSLWFFDPTQNQPWPRAVATFGGSAVTGAPTDIFALFVSPERFIFTLCSGMVVNVCSQGDPTTWTPATTNTAFARTLQGGSKLVAGRALAPYLSMVWSDNCAFLFQYTGSLFLYNSALVGRDCGLISPNAAIVVNGMAYWMGPNNFYFYNGAVQIMPNAEDVRQYILPNIAENVAFQVCAVYFPEYNEIRWYYTAPGNTQPSNYVCFHLNDNCWSMGVADFYSTSLGTTGHASGSHFSSGDTSPVLAGVDGYLYQTDEPNQWDDNGQPLTWTLTLAPYQINEAMEYIDLEGFRFDFFQQSGAITATVNTYDELTDTGPMDSQTVSVPDTGLAPGQTGLTDFRVSGRFLSLTLTQGVLGGYMRLGKCTAMIRPSGTRRG
jgi:hypothetical protein